MAKDKHAEGEEGYSGKRNDNNDCWMRT